MFLPVSAWSIYIRLSAETDKFHLTFSTSASLSKNEFFDKLKQTEQKLLCLLIKCVNLVIDRVVYGVDRFINRFKAVALGKSDLKHLGNGGDRCAFCAGVVH